MKYASRKNAMNFLLPITVSVKAIPKAGNPPPIVDSIWNILPAETDLTNEAIKGVPL